ncbi:Aste57867_17902 [Aphanomyces stellatus]|uniref:Aste57867_17902 protein n=1 Tax=Aphanomyces stellatus TaxID=120398 RepID=A0A485LAD5_9STRA|nr:hypothetical protein As57867_017841 [Aphanomyces stellatus]VFT94644.1 Aste57867_17902 [Aphanomyces stellatus]
MVTPMTACLFNGCDHVAIPPTAKCWYHRYRDPCEVEGCFNQARARKRCASHGGTKTFSTQSDASSVGSGRGLSRRNKRRCNVSGCSKFAHAKHRCVAHGGGTLCSVEGCQTQSRNGGMCQRHGRLLTEVNPVFEPNDTAWKNVVLDCSFFDASLPQMNPLQLEDIDGTTLEVLLTLNL